MSAAAVTVAAVVPPDNVVVASELHRLLEPALTPVVVPFPRHDGDLAARLRAYVGDLPATLRGLSGVGAAFVACTGSSYPLGARGDRAWSERSAAALGRPVQTAAGAVGDVLDRLGAVRVALVSPYPAWLTAQCREYWSESGRDVVAVHAVSERAGTAAAGGHPVYDLPDAAVTSTIEHAVADASQRGGVDAVVVAGTGAATLATIDRLLDQHDVPVVSSNLAGAWWLATATGAADGVHRAVTILRDRIAS